MRTGGGGDTGGVEDQPAERVGPATAEVVAHQVVVLVERRTQRLDDAAVTPDQQGAGQRRVARLVAAKVLRLWNTKLLGHKRSGAGVDNL